jgi:hypothetical protein
MRNRDVVGWPRREAPLRADPNRNCRADGDQPPEAHVFNWPKELSLAQSRPKAREGSSLISNRNKSGASSSDFLRGPGASENSGTPLVTRH